jgi:hypothetical protein
MRWAAGVTAMTAILTIATVWNATASDVAHVVAWAVGAEFDRDGQVDWRSFPEAVGRAIYAECEAACRIIRDIFGNPCRPVQPGPWVTPAAVIVARDCFDRGDFSAQPVLADLLEETGCPEQSVLEHCRMPENTRGGAGWWTWSWARSSGTPAGQGNLPHRRLTRKILRRACQIGSAHPH